MRPVMPDCKTLDNRCIAGVCIRDTTTGSFRITLPHSGSWTEREPSLFAVTVCGRYIVQSRRKLLKGKTNDGRKRITDAEKASTQMALLSRFWLEVNLN